MEKNNEELSSMETVHKAGMAMFRAQGMDEEEAGIACIIAMGAFMYGERYGKKKIARLLLSMAKAAVQQEEETGELEIGEGGTLDD